MHPLAGKSALVTGGSRGIGRAIVERLARDGALVTFSFVRDGAAAEAVVGSVRAADVADVVAFLAGPDGRWLTGQNLQATGGLS